MTASSLNSCARTICPHTAAQASRTHTMSRKPRRFIPRLAVRDTSRRLNKTDPRPPAMLPGDAGLRSHERRTAGGFRFRPDLASAAIALRVATPKIAVAVDGRELLYATAVDGL